MAQTDDLQTAADRIASRIAEYALALASDTDNPQPTYSLDGKSVDRNSWRTSIVDTMAKLREELTEIHKTINQISPYIIHTRQIV